MNLSIKPDLKDKVIVITGGGGVLCSMFAKAVASLGAKVAVLDLNFDLAEQVANQIKNDGFNAIGVRCNVLDKESIEQAHQTVLNIYGKCDILINGAGGNSPKATTDEEFFDRENFDTKAHKGFFDLDLDGFNFVFGLNFTGTLLPTQIFAKDMIDKTGASILNITSMNAYTPLTKIPAYSAAKAAVQNFTQWLAVYFAKSNIRVNAIAPGFFSTTQNKALLFNPDGTPTKRTAKILNNTPMNRFGDDKELLGALLFLIDEKSSSFVTGITIPVDGGFSSYSGV
jgi:NAD(P)-dependent dehydrogenase (short-subunit alcohol dehydrogenase family)